MFNALRLLILPLAVLVSFTAKADLAIIGHPDYNTGELDIQNVKRLFLGDRKSFPNGNYATPLNHTVGSSDRKEFFANVLNMAESSHKRHWKRKRSTGAGNSPDEASSHSEVLESVANNPGSISYIDARLVNESVKVLLTVSNFEGV